MIEPSGEAPGTAADDSSEPYLDVAGADGTSLRATASGLIVFAARPATDVWHRQGRQWPYARLRNVRLDDYGLLGVVRATIDTSGDDLPLLLLEPDQIAAARRVLEMVWNLMSMSTPTTRLTA